MNYSIKAPWLKGFLHRGNTSGSEFFNSHNFYAVFYARFSLLAQMGPQKTSVQMNAIS